MKDRTTGRVSTPLSDLTSAVVGDTGRRFAVAAMSSGVALTTLVSTVQTPDIQEQAQEQALATDTSIFDLEAMTGIEARMAVDLYHSQPAVTVSADAVVNRTEWVDGGSVRAIDATAAPIPRHYDQVGRVSTPSRGAGRSEDNYAEYRELAQQGTAERNYAAALVALRHLGVPYVWGGTTPAGFDCSGLVQYAFAQVGVNLPRTTQAMGASALVTPVSPQDAQPGDLVWRPTHVSIYLGDGLMVEASRPGSPVWVRELWHPSSQFLRVTG